MAQQNDTPVVAKVKLHVERMLEANLKQGVDHGSNYEYSFICPSPHEYTYQWFWDSCFHAIAMAHVEPIQAVREIETLLANQRADGFIGHVNFWGARLGGWLHPWAFGQSVPGEKLRTSALIQPPVLAQAIERVGQIIGDATFPHRFMPALDRYHEWLAEHRVPDDDGLLVIVSPYESGTDQSPAFDEALGFKSAPGRWRAGFRNRVIDLRNWLKAYNSEKMLNEATFYVKESLVNGCYAESLATMSRLYQKQGVMQRAAAYHTLAQRVSDSMLDKMLDRANGGFMSLVGREERRVKPLTVGAITPIAMPNVPPEVVDEIVERHLMRHDKFWLRYPVPSVAANEPTFNPREERLIWRGPTWVNTNWLVWRGLKAYGHEDEAALLAGHTVEMVAENGLWEFYNPLSGKGMGARSFGWSALALDMAGG